MTGLLDRLRALPPRTRGLVYLALGALLAVCGALALGAFAGAAADAGVRTDTPEARKAVGLLGLPFSLGMALGVSMIYIGLVKLALGAVTDKLVWDRLTAVGLLYVLGFIAALVLTGWLVLVRWELAIF